MAIDTPLTSTNKSMQLKKYVYFFASKKRESEKILGGLFSRILI